MGQGKGPTGSLSENFGSVSCQHYFTEVISSIFMAVKILMMIFQKLLLILLASDMSSGVLFKRQSIGASQWISYATMHDIG